MKTKPQEFLPEDSQVPEIPLDSPRKRREKGRSKVADLELRYRQIQKREGPDVASFSYEDAVKQVVPADITVEELLGLVRRDYDINRRRSASTAKYPIRKIADYFRKQNGSRVARHLTDAELEQYVLDRRRMVDYRGKPPQESTIKTELSMLHRGFSLAVRAGIISRGDVPRFPSFPADTMRVRMGWMRLSTLQLILPHLEGDVADFVEFLFFSAWRVSEARGLLWSWVDGGDENGENGEITLPRDKAGNRRSIPLDGQIAVILRRRADRALGDRVFHRGGRPIGDIRKQWYAACAKARQPAFILHDLRRSAVKRMVEEGVDRQTAKRWSGHTTDHVFERYNIDEMESMRKAAKRLAKPPTRIGTITTLPVPRKPR